MKNSKIEITFALPNLLPGGAERVISYIAQNIDASKFDATLLIVGKSSDVSYDVNNVNVIFLEKARVSQSILALYKYMSINKPDIFVSVISHLNTIVAGLSICFPKIKFIAREVTLLSLESNGSKEKKFDLTSFVSDHRFRFFDKIICQSKDMMNDIVENYKLDKNKLVLINNPVTDTFQLKQNHQVVSKKRFITVGSFKKVKGIERILKILSKVEFDFHYTLIGNGPERLTIFALIESYGLQDKITHIEYTNNVASYLEQSDYFLQGSYFEGFPNSLLESCAVGTPVIAFNAPGGTKEIVENGINGFLVETEDEFLNKLNDHREWEPKIVRDSVYKKFNKELILKHYEDLFINIMKA